MAIQEGTANYGVFRYLREPQMSYPAADRDASQAGYAERVEAENKLRQQETQETQKTQDTQTTKSRRSRESQPFDGIETADKSEKKKR